MWAACRKSFISCAPPCFRLLLEALGNGDMLRGRLVGAWSWGTGLLFSCTLGASFEHHNRTEYQASPFCRNFSFWKAVQFGTWPFSLEGCASDESKKNYSSADQVSNPRVCFLYVPQFALFSPSSRTKRSLTALVLSCYAAGSDSATWGALKGDLSKTFQRVCPKSEQYLFSVCWGFATLHTFFRQRLLGITPWH